MHVHQHTRSHICLRCYRGEDGARRNFLTERKKLLYMSRFPPAWGVREFAFQQRESKGRRKANQKRGVFLFYFNPSSAEAPFLLKKNLCFFHTASAITWNPITDHVTASIKFTIIMGQRHSTVRKYSNMAGSASVHTCFCVPVHARVCVCRALHGCKRDIKSERVFVESRKLTQTDRWKPLALLGNSSEPEQLSKSNMLQ